MSLLERNGYRLRAPEPEDLGVMMRFENTPSLWDVSTPTGPYSRFYLKQYIEENRNDLYADRQLRLMLETPDHEVAGIIDLFNFDPFHSRAELGMVVAEDFRGQGIGRLGLQMIKDYAFGYLGIHQLYVFIDESNHTCLALFDKYGFQRVGCMKDWMRSGAVYRDVVILQCIN